MCVHQTLPRVSFSCNLGAEQEWALGAEPQGRHGGLLCTPLAHGCLPLTAAAYGGNSLHFSLAFTAHSGVLSPSQVAGEIRQLWQLLLQLLVATAGGSRAVASRAVPLSI